MNDTKTIALSKAIALLRACGAKYKVVAEDGTEFGELKLAVEPVKRRRGSKYGWGAMAHYVRPHLDKMEVGQVAVIPHDKVIEVDDIYHSASKEMQRLYGNNAAVCARVANGIEVLRVA